MGYVNLYADIVTDELMHFVHSYKEGSLSTVMAIRVLEDKKQPFAYLKMAELEKDYIIFPIIRPVEDCDIAWLYTKLIVEQGENFDRKTAMDYAVGRVLGQRYIGRRVANPAAWAKVREFRRLLELPVMALRHFAKSCTCIEDHVVDRDAHTVAIEYRAKRKSPEERRLEKAQLATHA